MIQSPAIKWILTFVLCCLWGVAQAQDNLYIFVFKNGEAQKNVTISVGGQEKITNEFGLANFMLPAAEYEVGYYKKSELFALTEINLLADQQSQIFLTLTKDGERVELDLPLEAYEQNFEQKDIKEQTGPKGVLKFRLQDAKSEKSVANAKLFFKGYSIEATSDESGIANVELSEGKYDISVIHPKYIMKVLKNIEVKAESTQNENVKLVKSDIVLDEFVVSAPSVEGSLASSIADLKDSDVMADAISSEQFSKSGDSSASGALKRVTGITVVDGKYVYIRGLGERYSTILLNDLHIPSPEPTKRVVPLDIFPTSVIQEMSIQKTHSSNLPGTFAGGTVLIATKDIPKEDNFVKAAVSLNVNAATGKSVAYNPDNSKRLPSIILDYSDNFGELTKEVKLGSEVIAEGLTDEERDDLYRQMVNYRSYGLSNRKLKPGKGISFSLGQSFKTSSGLKYGVAGSLYYTTKEKSAFIEKDEYQYSDTNDSDTHIESAEFDVTKLKEKYGGLVSVGLDNQKGQAAKYTFLSLTEFEELTNSGRKNDLDDEEFNERVYLQYTEKRLSAHQLNGQHEFGKSKDKYFDNIVINWGAEFANASRLEPGTFEYEYKEESIGLVLDAKKLFYLYSDLSDEVINYRVDFKLPFKYKNRDNHTKFGIFDYRKSRNLDNRRFKIKYSKTMDTSSVDQALSESNVDNGAIEVLDSYKPDDFYTAEQNVLAFYVNQLISPMEKLDLSLGLRKESSVQKLQVGEEEDVYELDTSDILPSLGLTWRFNNERQIRFAYSNTISRPDFREFSPNRYKDPLTGNIIFGYAELKYTKIDNVDFKYEWYPSFDETLSIALFGKKFTNPIETVRTISDVDIETSYRNAKSATSIGLELGFRKNLQALSKKLKHYYVGGNYTYIKSKIDLDKNAPENINDQFIPNLTTEKRAMQGQSPYVINFQIGYDNFFTRRSAVLLYNVYGERISALGIDGNPDIYEQPFHKLDFVIKWGLNDTYDEQEKKIGYGLSFKASNLLNSAITRKQGNQTSYKYRPGRSFSLSFSMKY